MNRLLRFTAIFAVISLTCAEEVKTETKTINNVNNVNDFKRDSVVDQRRGRAAKQPWVFGIVDCAVNLDAVCFLDKSEDVLKATSRSFWANVDRQARAQGTPTEESPSALVESISKIISEISDLFKNGLEGLFRDAKEGEDEKKTEVEEDDDEVEEEEEDKEKEKNRDLGEARGKIKKKKKKKKALLKLLVLGLVLKAKLGLLLKAFAAHLQIKFLLIALAGLFINAIRLYFDLKKGHSPQKVIYYEHAQHQHHYDGGDEEWSSPGGGQWGRSYLVDSQENKSAQDLAYANQKPVGTTYSRVDDKPNFSW